MKIIAVGLNYKSHIEEFGASMPTEPLIFMKPDSALLKSNKPFYIPDFTSDLQYEAELIVKIDRLGKNISEKFASRYYSSIGLGIDFTARDIQKKVRDEGNPWELCKAFDGSAVISDFIPLTDLKNPLSINFSLKKNGAFVQKGVSSDMIFSIDKIIAYVSQFFTLKIGDIIFTGTPIGVGPVTENTRLEGFIEDMKMFDFMVK